MVYDLLGVNEKQTFEDEIELRWLLKNEINWAIYLGEWPLTVPFIDTQITQTELKHPKGYAHRIRKIECAGDVFYTRTITIPMNTMAIRKESTVELTEEEYNTCLKHTHPNQVTIEKIRRSFKWNDFIWEIDTFITPAHGLMILECETHCIMVGDFPTPPWLSITRQITYEPGWINTDISRVGWARPDNAD